MASLWNVADQTALTERLNLLHHKSPRQWGKMDVAQMLRHIDIAYKNALGEIPVSGHPLSVIVSLAPVRKLLIYGLPFQKNLPTAQEYKVRTAVDFQAAKDEFLRTFQKITQQTETLQFDAHPIFGKLSKEEWGALLYKHLDHHLKQFDV